MTILYITYALDGLLTIALPIVLAVIVTRKYDLYWRLYWIGAAVFALAEILLGLLNRYVIYPFLNNFSASSSLNAASVLVVSALILGLLTAIFEELFRYGMFRWWARDARSWADGVLTGIGHGGAAVIFLGALVIYNYVNMMMFRNSDLTKVFTPEQVPYVQSQLSAFWSAPWYTTLNDFLQALFILPTQIALALVVLQAFIRKQWFWVLIALLTHMIFEASRLVAQNLLSPLLTDLVIILFGLAAIAVIFALRPADPTKQFATGTVKA